MSDAEHIALTRGLQDGVIDAGTVFIELRQIYFNARFDAFDFEVPHVQLAAMTAIVAVLGKLINDITLARSKLEHVEDGLLGFDADLAGLTARYTHMYRAGIDGGFDLTNPTQYEQFERFLEGPILLWDRKTCIDNWPLSVGYCEGPDLLTGLSMLHQVGVAHEHEQELLQSYVATAASTFRGLVESAEGLYDAAAARTKQGLKAAGEAIAEGATAVGGVVEDAVVKPATRSLAVAVGIGAVAFVGYGLWTSTQKGTNH